MHTHGYIKRHKTDAGGAHSFVDWYLCVRRAVVLLLQPSLRPWGVRPQARARRRVQVKSIPMPRHGGLCTVLTLPFLFMRAVAAARSTITLPNNVPLPNVTAGSGIGCSTLLVGDFSFVGACDGGSKLLGSSTPSELPRVR